jgi:hypothetical protein
MNAFDDLEATDPAFSHGVLGDIQLQINMEAEDGTLLQRAYALLGSQQPPTPQPAPDPLAPLRESMERAVQESMEIADKIQADHATQEAPTPSVEDWELIAEQARARIRELTGS